MQRRITMGIDMFLATEDRSIGEGANRGRSGERFRDQADDFAAGAKRLQELCAETQRHTQAAQAQVNAVRSAINRLRDDLPGMMNDCRATFALVAENR